MIQYNTKTEKETTKLGRDFALGLCGGDVVLLKGELGSGKTTFVKGVALGLGVREDVTSPTFTLMNLYGLKRRGVIERLVRVLRRGTAHTLCHIDTYRLRSAAELEAIGALDYLGQPDIISIIEWPEKIDVLVRNHVPPEKIITVTFEHLVDGRKITII